MAVDLFDIMDVEQLLSRYLQSKNLAFVQPGADNPGGRQRIYTGAENYDVQGPNPEGDSQVNADIEEGLIPGEGAESSIVRLPCIICACQEGPTPEPSRELAGIWEPACEIAVCSEASDSTTGDITLSSDHRKRAKLVWAQFLTDSFIQDLCAFSATCGAFPPDTKFQAAAAVGWRQSWASGLGAWTSSLHFTLRQARLVPIDWIDHP